MKRRTYLQASLQASLLASLGARTCGRRPPPQGDAPWTTLPGAR